ncbi:MAG: hypothetical protein ACRDJU_09225, partial [Actinomycetota bacterium]
MEVPLVEHLAALERPDLEVLLRRRPEARSLIGAKRCDMAALASAISTPESVFAAADALNGFLRNLLHAALFLGARASASSLSALAPDVDPLALAAGATELSRWGLAFVEPVLPPGTPANGHTAGGGGRPVEPQPNGVIKGPAAGVNGCSMPAGPGDWRLFVPACVLNVIPLPNGLGVRLTRVLAGGGSAYLEAIAANLGLKPAGDTGPGLVAQIVAVLGDTDRV